MLGRFIELIDLRQELRGGLYLAEHKLQRVFVILRLQNVVRNAPQIDKPAVRADDFALHVDHQDPVRRGLERGLKQRLRFAKGLLGLSFFPDFLDQHLIGGRQLGGAPAIAFLELCFVFFELKLGHFAITLVPRSNDNPSDTRGVDQVIGGRIKVDVDAMDIAKAHFEWTRVASLQQSCVKCRARQREILGMNIIKYTPPNDLFRGIA